jgi:hypothetical protein
MHANVAHGNLIVVYELDILQSPLSLDECFPPDWMTISLFQSHRIANFHAFTHHMHSLNGHGNFFWNPKCLIGEGLIIMSMTQTP